MVLKVKKVIGDPTDPLDPWAQKVTKESPVPKEMRAHQDRKGNLVPQEPRD